MTLINPGNNDGTLDCDQWKCDMDVTKLWHQYAFYGHNRQVYCHTCVTQIYHICHFITTNKREENSCNMLHMCHKMMTDYKLRIDYKLKIDYKKKTTKKHYKKIDCKKNTTKKTTKK